MHNWEKTACGEASEQIPDNAPTPLGNAATLTHYVDANLMHDLLSGRSVNGMLHFANQTIIDWHCKKQGSVETATYGSEFVAAKNCTEQIQDLRHTLRYLGVPIRGKSHMFGDNESVVDSSAFPHARLQKRHNILSFHKVREQIAAKTLAFIWIPGHINPADMLSKHWGCTDMWDVLRPMLFNTEGKKKETKA